MDVDVNSGRCFFQHSNKHLRLGLRRCTRAVVCVRTWVAGCSRPRPCHIEIPIDVDTNATAARILRHVLAVHARARVRVVVAVWVSHGHNYNFCFIQIIWILLHVFNKLLHLICATHRRDPLSGMYNIAQEHPRLPRGPACTAETDDFDIATLQGLPSNFNCSHSTRGLHQGLDTRIECVQVTPSAVELVGRGSGGCPQSVTECSRRPASAAPIRTSICADHTRELIILELSCGFLAAYDLCVTVDHLPPNPSLNATVG